MLSSARSPKRRNFTNTQKKILLKNPKHKNLDAKNARIFTANAKKKRGKLLLSTFFYQLKYLENGALKF